MRDGGLGPSRGVVSTARANPGTRLYTVPLAKPSFANASPQIRTQIWSLIDGLRTRGATIPLPRTRI